VIAALARPTLARVTRRPRALLAVGAWCLLALGMAVASRARGVPHGADHVLIGAFGGLALPLLAYTLVGAVVGARSLSTSTAPVVAFGAPPGRAAAVTIAIGVLGCALFGAVLAAVVALAAHGAGDPAPAGDALASAYAGALGGGAYGGWFLLGSTLGRRGGGRTVLLVVDWLLGVGTGPTALVVPRAYLRCLLGGTGPLELSGRECSAAIVALGVVCVLVALQRARAIR
jgi:hypothetical protein